VGMHLLANDSEEGKLTGLGYISGRVRRISNDYFTSAPHLPHMGWNSINLKSKSLLFDGIDSKIGFYFLHSYQFDCEEPKNASAEVLYGKSLSCAIENENIFGVQFHPEKSHSNGVILLKNFAKLI
jgi:imidazole glycerol-phosphate synthase subunit HisH